VIIKPIPGAYAFEAVGEEAGWSQAAQLVGLGLQLNGRTDILNMNDDAESLDIPQVPRVTHRMPIYDLESFLRSRKIDVPFRWHMLHGWSQPTNRRMFESNQIVPPDPQTMELAELVDDVSLRLYEETLDRHSDTDTRAAEALLHLSQFSRYQVVRVAAAAILASRRLRLWWPTIEALADGCLSESDTVQQIAADALSHIAPRHPALLELLSQMGKGNQPGTSSAGTSIIIPGTWARFRSLWWQPGGSLFRYLQQEPGQFEPADATLLPVGHDLYEQADFYRWTDGLSGTDRTAAADDLARWAGAREVHDFKKVIAHSHGGNVALDAAALCGLRIDLLVMLHTPPHRRSNETWGQISEVVQRIVSMRTKFDLVVLLDLCWSSVKLTRTTWKFPKKRVHNWTFPFWFSHGTLTDPDVWMERGIAKEVAAAYALTRPNAKPTTNPTTLTW
jgi:hypothetical protein